VDEPIDPVVDDDLLQALEVEDVGEDEGPLLDVRLRWLDDVGQYDILVAVTATKQLRAFRAQLPETPWTKITRYGNRATRKALFLLKRERYVASFRFFRAPSTDLLAEFLQRCEKRNAHLITRHCCYFTPDSDFLFFKKDRVIAADDRLRSAV